MVVNASWTERRSLYEHSLLDPDELAGLYIISLETNERASTVNEML